jgi:hypothetical protein
VKGQRNGLITCTIAIRLNGKMPYHEVICRAKRQREAAIEAEIEAAIETAKSRKTVAGSEQQEASSRKRAATGKGQKRSGGGRAIGNGEGEMLGNDDGGQS